MASYWTRKDDQSDELRTVKPWETEVGKGNVLFPDPDGERQGQAGAKEEDSEGG